MNLNEEIKSFMSPIGAVSTWPINPNSNNNSGNDLSYTAMWMVLKHQYNDLSPQEIEDNDSLILKYIVHNDDGIVLDRCVDKPAWQNSWDDYTSVICSLQIIDPFFARLLSLKLSNPRKFWGIFKFRYYLSNVLHHSNKPATHMLPEGKWNWGAHLGRFLHLRCHFAWAKGIRNRFLELAWAINLIITSNLPLKKADGLMTNQHFWRMGWLMIQAYKATGFNSFFCNIAVKKFKKELDKKISGDIRLSQKEYWNENHPVIKYLKTNL